MGEFHPSLGGPAKDPLKGNQRDRKFTLAEAIEWAWANEACPEAIEQIEVRIDDWSEFRSDHRNYRWCVWFCRNYLPALYLYEAFQRSREETEKAIRNGNISHSDVHSAHIQNRLEFMNAFYNAFCVEDDK